MYSALAVFMATARLPAGRSAGTAAPTLSSLASPSRSQPTYQPARSAKGHRAPGDARLRWGPYNKFCTSQQPLAALLASDKKVSVASASVRVGGVHSALTTEHPCPPSRVLVYVSRARIHSFRRAGKTRGFPMDSLLLTEAQRAALEPVALLEDGEVASAVAAGALELLRSGGDAPGCEELLGGAPGSGLLALEALAHTLYCAARLAVPAAALAGRFSTLVRCSPGRRPLLPHSSRSNASQGCCAPVCNALSAAYQAALPELRAAAEEEASSQPGPSFHALHWRLDVRVRTDGAVLSLKLPARRPVLTRAFPVRHARWPAARLAPRPPPASSSTCRRAAAPLSRPRAPG